MWLTVLDMQSRVLSRHCHQAELVLPCHNLVVAGYPSTDSVYWLVSADVRVICQGNARAVSLLPRLDRQRPAHCVLAVRILFHSGKECVYLTQSMPLRHLLLKFHDIALLP